MAYSSFFTTGLTLASLPRDLPFHALPPLPCPLQVTLVPSTPTSRRPRKRRTSLTLANSPISTIKSPMREAEDAAKSQTVHARGLREGSLGPLEALTGRDRARPRRKTFSDTKELPALPAPTEPLPTLPPHMFAPSVPQSPAPCVTPTSPHSPSHLYPFAMPSPTSPLLRGPFTPSPYAGNTQTSFSACDVTEKECVSPPEEWRAVVDAKENVDAYV
ncbi:hypothetical protein K439DRAFT_1640178 [Ramaria rubella]|nr:hypothetical protein K439DRAFT_1640178 [Ramaria rubella]